MIVRRKIGTTSPDCPPEIEKAMDRALNASFQQTKEAIARQTPKGDRKDGN